jgi:predicted transposase YdaD
LKESSETVPDRHEDRNVVARYEVVKMWEQDPRELLDHEGLLPLSTLCRDEGQGEKLLQRIAVKLEDIDDKNLQAHQTQQTQLLAGLRYNSELVYQILRGGDMLEESSVYQDILRKGVQQGFTKGEKHLVIRMLESKLGKLSLKTRNRINELSLGEVERLGEALLGFTSKADLNEWLKKITIDH